ncbi:MAG: VOC family protein [Motiliproteus sp.]
MSSAVSYITLAVTDLDRQVAFYRDGFGFTLKTHRRAANADEDSWAFFDLDAITLALYDQKALARDANITAIGAPTGAITLSHNVVSKQRLEELMSSLEQAGASITRPACQAPWGGYRGYLKDPEGFLWEIVWSPTRNP